MHGNLMYEVARQRVAEQRRAAELAGEARARRKAARGRHAKGSSAETVAAPAIPDFAHEMFDGLQEAVPAPREEGGKHARTNR